MGCKSSRQLKDANSLSEKQIFLITQHELIETKIKKKKLLVNIRSVNIHDEDLKDEVLDNIFEKGFKRFKKINVILTDEPVTKEGHTSLIKFISQQKDLSELEYRVWGNKTINSDTLVQLGNSLDNKANLIKISLELEGL